MELSFSMLFAAVIGFGHAFEPDHLVAVGNIVTKRNNLKQSIADGIYWGFGHTSTIFLIGLLMIVGKSTFLTGYFGYLEAGVGLMLIILGVCRLFNYYRNIKSDSKHNQIEPSNQNDGHHLAYGVGLIHGLAGSGAMILLVMAEVKGSLNSMLYLLIFGIGSVIGMMIAAGIFSLPFSKRMSKNENVYFGLVLLSSLLCIFYGTYVIFENLN